MTEADRPEGALGLADFLSDLRAELAEASRRAEGQALRLGVDEVTLSLDIGVTLTTTGEASAKAVAKFWVFASAEAGVRGERSSERMTTQHLTLTLRPRIEEVVRDESGRQEVRIRGLDVGGAFAEGEERPDL
jgi:hypothetical protein